MKKFTEPAKVSNYFHFGVDVDNLELSLFKEIDEESSANFILGLNFLHIHSRDKGKYKPIVIHLNSPGGYIHDGMAIYDAIKTIPNQIVTIVYGEACSMGSIILQASDRRIMMPHSALMIHDGDTDPAGTPRKVRAQLAYEDIALKTMTDIYAERMKHSTKFKHYSKQKIKDWIGVEISKKEDVYFSAKQAVEVGLADEIITSWRSVRK